MANLRVLIAFFCGLAVFYVASAVISTAWQSYSQTSVWSSVSQAERIIFRTGAVLIASLAFALAVHISGVTIPSAAAMSLGLATGPVALIVVLLLGGALSWASPAIPSALLVRSLALLCHAVAGGSVGFLACAALGPLRST